MSMNMENMPSSGSMPEIDFEAFANKALGKYSDLQERFNKLPDAKAKESFMKKYNEAQENAALENADNLSKKLGVPEKPILEDFGKTYTKQQVEGLYDDMKNLEPLKKKLERDSDQEIFRVEGLKQAEKALTNLLDVESIRKQQNLPPQDISNEIKAALWENITGRENFALSSEESNSIRNGRRVSVNLPYFDRQNPQNKINLEVTKVGVGEKTGDMGKPIIESADILKPIKSGLYQNDFGGYAVALSFPNGKQFSFREKGVDSGQNIKELKGLVENISAFLANIDLTKIEASKKELEKIDNKISQYREYIRELYGKSPVTNYDYIKLSKEILAKRKDIGGEILFEQQNDKAM